MDSLDHGQNGEKQRLDRRLVGRSLLTHIPRLTLVPTVEEQRISARHHAIAKNYVEKFNPASPVLLHVCCLGSEETFLWTDEGFFSAKYAEDNYFLFPCLRRVYEIIGDDG